MRPTRGIRLKFGLRNVLEFTMLLAEDNIAKLGGARGISLGGRVYALFIRGGLTYSIGYWIAPYY
jgi:hypothetical protein